MRGTRQEAFTQHIVLHALKKFDPVLLGSKTDFRP